MTATEPAHARELWQRLETLHAVTYFGEETIAAARQAGLRGFWMGYFGLRAAPMGAVNAATVVATFANFAAAMVERSIPDAWTFASPSSLIEPRAAAAASTIRRVTTDPTDTAERCNDLLQEIVDAANPVARPLFAANAALAAPTDPVARLWQLATCMREHRGDGHVHALASAGLDGIEAHVLFAADSGTPEGVLRDNRGWTQPDWDAAGERLTARALLQDDEISPAGRTLRDRIETETDRLAQQPIDAALSRGQQQSLVETLNGPAGEIATSGVIPYPNPMGLPAVDA